MSSVENNAAYFKSCKTQSVASWISRIDLQLQIIHPIWRTPRYHIFLGHSVEMKQSPIDGNSHITKECKCLGGLKPNFNFDWGKTGIKYIYICTLLENKTDLRKTTKVRRIWEIYNFMAKLVEDYEKWVKPFIINVWGYTEILPMFLLVGVE